MQTTKRLGRQITLAFLLFGTALTVVLGLSLVAALKSVETGMLDGTLRDELAHFRSQVETARPLGAFHSRTTIIHVTPLTDIEHIPAYLRALPVGMHDLTHAGRDYRVLVEHIGDTRYTVQFDDTNIHQRKRDFVRLVWLSSLVVLLIAFAVGWWLARRVSGPVTRLANQVTVLKDTPYASLDVSTYNDDEIGLLARQLQHYHEQLQQLLAREKEFAGNVSHELRTPVTNISLAAEVLAAKPGLPAKDHERLQRIQRATREMSELVDTFLVLAQIDDDSNKSHSACEVLPIVKEVVKQQRVWLGDKPVEVIVDEKGPLRVAAPPRILSVLIANLVRNAFRYTERGTITVVLHADRLTVADTGVGIDAPTQSRLFERHVRGKSGDKDGAGLGLAIVQRVCERYGWTVTFDSTEGQGSRFSVRFVSATVVPQVAERCGYLAKSPQRRNSAPLSGKK